MNWFKKLRKDKRGFTLVELLVVIAILGVLIALAVPRVLVSLDDAEVSACEANRKTIQSAIERYYAELGSTAAAPTAAAGGTLVGGASSRGPWLAEWPTCPSTGTDTYTFTGSAPNLSVDCSTAGH